MKSQQPSCVANKDGVELVRSFGSFSGARMFRAMWVHPEHWVHVCQLAIRKAFLKYLLRVEVSKSPSELCVVMAMTSYL